MSVLVSQDRDFAIRYDNPDEQLLHVIPNIEDNKIYDFSLMLGNYFLGTFNDSESAADEMLAITKVFWNDPEGKAIHQVSGFCRLTDSEEEEIQAMAECIREFPEMLEDDEDE